MKSYLVEVVFENYQNRQLIIKYLNLPEEIELLIFPKTDESGFMSFRYPSDEILLLKLSNQFLSERMRISYIDNDLKDKYRR